MRDRSENGSAQPNGLRENAEPALEGLDLAERRKRYARSRVEEEEGAFVASFYGNPPNFSLTKKSPVSKTAPGRLLRYGVPRHPDVIDR